MATKAATTRASTKRSELFNFAVARRPSIAERLAAGKALRERVPRVAHAEYTPPAKRQDPIAIIKAQAKTRLPQLVPIRHARMLTSPFAFLRGSAAVMIADIAGAPVTGMTVQACGDMHVSNFGVFASAERNLVFGINDFDETFPAPWEWDLKRLAASAVVCARYVGGDRVDAEAAARQVVQSYRERMRQYAEFGYLELWYERIEGRDVLNVLSRKARRAADRIMTKARGRTHLQVLEKMADLVNDKQRIVEAKPLIVRETKTQSGRPMLEAIDAFLQSYVNSLTWDRRYLLDHYRLLDVARKVVGVGSVGTRCWIILFSGAHDGDPLFLQVKEAQKSVLAPYAKTKTPYTNEGRRVVVGQRIIQGAPDIFLGWAEQDGFDFYVRQLRDMKGGAEFAEGETILSNFVEYCGLCGWALALAHAKSGDAAMIAGYCGNSDELDQAIAKFSQAYADQTERDHATMAQAAKRGELAVATQF
jgi:uncharacterized protein (DUF2252 family)